MKSVGLVDPFQDAIGMRLYFPLLIEQAVMSNQPMVKKREQQRVESGTFISRRIGQFASPTVPVAYEMAFAHLSELDFRLQVASCSELGLNDEEIVAISILRECRDKFWSTRSRCNACGTVTAAGGGVCPGCATKQ